MTREFELSPENAGSYLEEQGFLPEDCTHESASLGGGVSNHVIAVRWDEDCVVAKQPLPNLAVEDDWPADVTRVHNEAECARTYSQVISERGLDAHVPAVRFENTDDNVIAIECAPDDAVMWKRELLDAEVDIEIAGSVGEVLAAVHETTANDEAVRDAFGSKRPFDQLRIDPYHRTTARRHPDVGDLIMDEVDRIMNVDRTLVHGDYSPKNVIVDRGGDDTPWVLDFEVAHWGDPAFDTGFMMNHLFIKSVFNHEAQSEFLDAAAEFWDAYDAGVPWDIEHETVTELGVLMLARVDGKSPVEYVEEGPIADALRAIAKRTLRGEADTIEEFADLARKEAESR